jgi:hypothetical protein
LYEEVDEEHIKHRNNHGKNQANDDGVSDQKEVDETCHIPLNNNYCAFNELTKVYVCSIPLEALIGDKNNLGIIVDNTGFPTFKDPTDGSSRILVH